jgi:hypothetical protein
MRRSTIAIVATALLVAGFGSTLLAQKPPSVAGRWTGVIDTDIGSMPVSLQIAVENDMASGTITTPHGELVISKGAWVKDRWRLPFSGDGMKGEIVGTVTGDGFEGVWDNSPTATGSITLRRVK